jgi:hypothetical protein
MLGIGEFNTEKMEYEDERNDGGHAGNERRLSNFSSIFSLSRYFEKAADVIRDGDSDVITIDGGPHTFWW